MNNEQIISAQKRYSGILAKRTAAEAEVKKLRKKIKQLNDQLDAAERVGSWFKLEDAEKWARDWVVHGTEPPTSHKV